MLSRTTTPLILGESSCGRCFHQRRRRRRRRKAEIQTRIRGLVGILSIFAAGTAIALLQRRVTGRSGSSAEPEESRAETEWFTTLGVDVLHQGAEWTTARDRELAGSASCEDNYYADGNLAQALLLIVGILFTFNGLAIVCDEFFQASLEKISDVLNLTPDVAGATFLAAGSSAPELFTSFADAFGPSNSIGVGTIVGSAMFNMLVIVAMSAAVAARSGASLKIDHRVVARDVSFYSGSIVLLVAFFSDGKITWWEGLIMVAAYALYIVFMVFNTKILDMCSPPRILPDVTDEGETSAPELLIERRNGGSSATSDVAPGNAPDDAAARVGLNGGGSLSVPPNGAEAEQSGESRRGSHSDQRKASRALRVSFRQGRPSLRDATDSSCAADAATVAAAAAAGVGAGAGRDSGRTNDATEQGKQQEDQRPGGLSDGAVDRVEACNGGDLTERCTDQGGSFAAPSPALGPTAQDLDNDRLEWPQGWGERLMFVFGLPFMIGLSLTVPDCSRPEYEKYYVVTFVMSIVWISMITKFMVDLATGAACILGVSAVVMGVLVLAVGTSVPDMIGSMIAAKNGEASMAIANAVGSNVFDVLLGLGLPWLIRPFYFGEATPVDKDGASKALIILFGTVAVFVGSLTFVQWTMNETLGYCLIAIYMIYVAYTIASEAMA